MEFSRFMIAINPNTIESLTFHVDTTQRLIGIKGSRRKTYAEDLKLKIKKIT